MSRLEELIAKLCPDGVEYKELKDILIIKNGKGYATFDEGDVPVYGSGGIIAYIDNFIYDKPSVLIPRKGSIDKLYYVDKPFWNVDTIFYTVVDIEQVVPKFVFYYLQSEHLERLNKAGGVPSLTQEILNKIILPVPPLEIQSEIVRILDTFSELKAELKAELKTELKARKEQYEYYLKILAGSENNAKMKRKPLCEIAEIGTGSSNTNEGLEIGTYPFFVRSQEVLRKDEYEFDETAIITSGDGVGVGKILHYVEGKYALHQRAYRIHIIDDKVLPKFFYYYMKGTFLDYIKKECFHSSVTSIRRPMMNKYPVPIIPIEEQKRIVSILDNYDKLCTSLTSGLPAEIEGREKQYEYYRDLLLTFKPKVTA